MKPLKNILILLCSLLLLSASCKKKKSENPIDDLPPATQTGANTFGCLVNGELFLPKGSGLGGPVLRVQYVYDNGIYTLYLSASNRGSEINKNLSFEIKDIFLGSSYVNVLNNDSTNRGEFFITDKLLNTNSYKTNSTNQGNFNITNWNASKGIISGNFSYNAVNTTGEKVEIREGRFDVKL